MRRVHYYLTQGWVFVLVWFFWTVGHVTPSAGSTPYQLSDVRVIYMDSYWNVVLTGSKSMTYKAIKTSDPLRVIVDLPNTLSKPSIRSSILGNGIIGTIRIATVVHDPQPLTRVEIILNQEVSYKINKVGEKIFVSLKTVPPLPKAEPSHIEPAAEGKAGLPPPELIEVQAADTLQPTAEEPEQISKEPLPPASKILAIEPVEMGEDFDVHIIGDGRFENYDVSLLYDPPRLIVDLLGLRSTEVRDDLILSGPWTNRVRIGQHAEKVRVVFDLSFTPKGKLPFQVILEENRLVVSLESDGQE